MANLTLSEARDKCTGLTKHVKKSKKYSCLNLLSTVQTSQFPAAVSNEYDGSAGRDVLEISALVLKEQFGP